MSWWLFAILDDISVLMDDIATMTKLATKKTAWILWDDIAVNAKQATWFHASREIPVILAIIKWSFVNKLIIIPIVFIFSIIAPWFIKFVLLIWGIYLAYEWFEKILEWIYLHKKEVDNKKNNVSEKQKIKSAIITDFILSLEIVIIAFSTVLDANWQVRLFVVSVVSLLATIWVYWLVALIVKIDDFGLWLIKRSNWKWFLSKVWEKMVISLPYIIKIIGIIWVLAMLLVAWGIFLHTFHGLQEFIHLPWIISEFIVWIIVWFISWIILSIFFKIKSSIDFVK